MNNLNHSSEHSETPQQPTRRDFIAALLGTLGATTAVHLLLNRSHSKLTLEESLRILAEWDSEVEEITRNPNGVDPQTQLDQLADVLNRIVTHNRQHPEYYKNNESGIDEKGLALLSKIQVHLLRIQREMKR